MIPCTLRQLEIFVAAAEDCHFARTANRFGISQPAVTNHIATLEDQLGRRLFIRRRGTTPVLSSDGAAFLGQARSFLAEGENIRAFRASTAAGARCVARVAAGAHILEDCLRPRLWEFYRDHPNAAIECRTVKTLARGFQLLERGEVDFLLFTTGRPGGSGFAHEALRPVQLRLYGGRAFEAHRRARPEQLERLPFVLPQEGSEQDRFVRTALEGIGMRNINVAMHAQYTDVMTNLAIEGCGIVVLFETMVEDHLARGDLIAFDLELMELQRMLYRRDPVLPEPLLAAEGFLRGVLAS